MKTDQTTAVQADLSLRWLHMSESMFSQVAAELIHYTFIKDCKMPLLRPFENKTAIKTSFCQSQMGFSCYST